MLLALSTPALAAGDEPTAVSVRHVDLAVGTRADADKLLGRLGEAALEACGASSFSLSQYRQAVRHSPCWRASMTDVVQRIDNPLLTAAFEKRGLQQAMAAQGETAGGR
jgi:UrcA family protein